MRHPLIALSLLLGLAAPAGAQLSVGISSPGISIGINLPLFPELQRVPGYPVYYAPGVASNYFFYDGMYWVYENDTWYSSSWYNGPWDRIGPQAVPLYLLRVPVRYYRSPPTYFRGWQADAPPRWGEHWGNDWAQQRPGWDRWNRNTAPAPAPLPSYQRQYSQDRYPHAEQQQALRQQNYKYQARDPEVRQHVPSPAPALMKPLPVAPHAPQAAPPAQHANPAPQVPRQPQPQPQPQQHEQRPTPNRPQEQAPHAAPAHEPAPAAARAKDRQPPEGQGKERDAGDERDRSPKK